MYTLLIGALFSSYINPHKRRWDSITDQARTLSLSYPVDSESMKDISRDTVSISQIYEVNISLPLNSCSLPIISDFLTVLEPRMVACSIKVNISYVYQSAITQLLSSYPGIMKFHQKSLFLTQSLPKNETPFSISYTQIDQSQMYDTFTDSVILNSVQNIHIYLIETDNLGFITPVTDNQEIWHRVQQINQCFQDYVQKLGFNTQVTVFRGDTKNYNIPSEKTLPSHDQTFPSIIISDPSPIDLPYAIISHKSYWSNGYLNFKGTSCEQIPPITNLVGLKLNHIYPGTCDLSRFRQSLKHLYIVDYTNGNFQGEYSNGYFEILGIGETIERVSIDETKYPVFIPEMLITVKKLEILNTTKLVYSIHIGGDPNRKIEIYIGSSVDHGSVDNIRFMPNKYQPYKEIVIDGKFISSSILLDLPVTEITLNSSLPEITEDNLSIKIFRYQDFSPNIIVFIKQLDRLPNLIYAELVVLHKPLKFVFDEMGSVFDKWIIEGPMIIQEKREINTQYIYKFIRK
jgi:hypothetical protein